VENVHLKVDGDKLVITVDLKPKGKLSSTGKTLLVASTRGATALSSYAKRDITVALNVMAKAAIALCFVASLAAPAWAGDITTKTQWYRDGHQLRLRTTTETPYSRDVIDCGPEGCTLRQLAPGTQPVEVTPTGVTIFRGSP
jgi:hypothetical protein